MAIGTYKYEEDLTGESPDNLVAGEKRTLANLPLRVVAPDEGCFFDDSLVIIDDATGKPLTKAQYQIAEPSIIASEKAGTSVSYVFIIKDQTVSANITYTYQCFGGTLAYSNQALAAQIAYIVNSQGTVDWNNINGKPDLFAPAPHQHDVGDVFGFEYQVEALYMIRDAIVLLGAQNMQAFNALIQNQLNSFVAQINQVQAAFAAADTGLAQNIATINQQLNGLYAQVQQAVALMAQARADFQTQIAELNTALANIPQQVAAIQNTVDSFPSAYVSISKTNLGIFTAVNVGGFTVSTLQNLGTGGVVEATQPNAAMLASSSLLQSTYNPNNYPPLGFGDAAPPRVSYQKIAQLGTSGFVVTAQASRTDSNGTRYDKMYFGVKRDNDGSILWKELVNSVDIASSLQDVVLKSTTHLGQTTPNVMTSVSDAIYAGLQTGTMFSAMPANLYANGAYGTNATPSGTDWWYITKLGVRDQQSGYSLLAINFFPNDNNMVYVGVSSGPSTGSGLTWKRVATGGEIAALSNQIASLTTAGQAAAQSLATIQNTLSDYGNRISTLESQMANMDGRGKVSATAGNLLQMNADGIYYGIVAAPSTAVLYVDAIFGNDGNVGNDPAAPLRTLAAAASKGIGGTNRTICLKEGQTHVVEGTNQVYFAGGGGIYIHPYGPQTSALPPVGGDDPFGSLAGLNLGTRILMKPNRTTIDAAGTKWIYGSCFYPNTLPEVRFVAITFDVDTTEMNQYLAAGYNWQLNKSLLLCPYTEAKYEFHRCNLITRAGIDYFGERAQSNSVIFTSACTLTQGDAGSKLHTCPTAGPNILFNDWGRNSDDSARDIRDYISGEIFSCSSYVNLMLSTQAPNPTNLGTQNATFLTLGIGMMQGLLCGQSIMINPNDTGNDYGCLPTALKTAWVYIFKMNSRNNGAPGGSFIATNFNDPNQSYIGTMLGDGSYPKWTPIGLGGSNRPIVDIMLGDAVFVGGRYRDYVFFTPPSGYVLTATWSTEYVDGVYARPLLVKVLGDSNWYIVRQGADIGANIDGRYWNKNTRSYVYLPLIQGNTFSGPTLSAV